MRQSDSGRISLIAENKGGFCEDWKLRGDFSPLRDSQKTKNQLDAVTRARYFFCRGLGELPAASSSAGTQGGLPPPSDTQPTLVLFLHLTVAEQIINIKFAGYFLLLAQPL